MRFTAENLHPGAAQEVYIVCKFIVTGTDIGREGQGFERVCLKLAYHNIISVTYMSRNIHC